MIRELFSNQLHRWANLHPFIRFLIAGILLTAVGLVSVKPAYRVFRKWRMERNLEAAQQAMEETRMQEARDLSLTVLRSGDPKIEAFRILEKATSMLGDPRHPDIARALIAHPEGTDEDRLTGFLTVVMDMPLGMVGHVWNFLSEESRIQPAFAAAFARRLLEEKRLGEALKVLLDVPEDKRDTAVRQALARVLIQSGKSEGYEEAQRMIAAGLAEDGADVKGWLDVLEELPVISLRQDLLFPMRGRMREWTEVDPARVRLLQARMDYAWRWGDRSRILEPAIQAWREKAPYQLARFLRDLGLNRMMLDTFSEEQANSDLQLLRLLLDAARNIEDWESFGKLLDSAGDQLPKALKLSYRALLAAKTAEPAARNQAWRAAIAEARTDAGGRALLSLYRMAREARLDELAEMAILEAIRSGRGPLPLFEELRPLFLSLSRSGQEAVMLEICAIYLRYEPSNPILLTQYAYLACLLDVIEPAKLLPPLEMMAAAFPKELPVHMTLAVALLSDGQHARAAEVLDPFDLERKDLAPAYRAVYLACELQNGRITGDDPRIRDFPWTSLQVAERRKFTAMLRVEPDRKVEPEPQPEEP